MEKTLREGIDYYISTDGLLVFTEKYLLERGYCCWNDCRHCPYKVTNTLKVEKENIS